MGYMIACDDYGVMRCSVQTIQDVNEALARRPQKTIERALLAIVDVGLLMSFDHQSRAYLCQWDWQTWQHVKHPRSTIHPAPPIPVLNRCDDATKTLFREHHPRLVDAPQPPGVDAHQRSDVDGQLITATANGNGSYLGIREAFAAFWKAYPRKVGKEAAWKIWQRMKPSPEQLSQMIAALTWQVLQEQWLRDGGQFVPHPSTYLNQGRWQDEPVFAASVNRSTVAIVKAGEEFLKS
jgi:hypothetical protein